MLAAKIKAARPQSIAICLLFSFANPNNELAVARAVRSLGAPLSISHQVLPEFREYERTSTVAINAYLQPVMQSYLENLERRTTEAKSSGKESQPGTTVDAWVFSGAETALKKSGVLAPREKSQPHIFVMQSSGGITSLASAAREPVRTVFSGPAGGVVGATAGARGSGFDRIIAFDMGGTSTDVSLVEGAITTASHAEIAGLPIGVPMLDIHTVGAGGGSLARFDAAGVLRVGPESAGADPGPICYGRGTQPTVTDANLLLGRLQPERFLGGDFTLDLERTRRLTRQWLKKQGSPLSVEKFASGVIRVVNATMEKAIRVVSIERGRDPRDFALVAFGGAGGLHACALADALSIPHVIVPAFPGALSAWGILASDIVKDYSRTVLWRVAGRLPTASLEREFSLLKKRAAEDFRAEAWRGRIQYQESVDLRYRSQGYELNLPFAANLLQRFEGEHKLRYGYAHSGREVEIVTLRLRASVKTTTHVGISGAGRASARAKIDEPSGKRPVLFGDKKLSTNIYSRDALLLRKRYAGPAIVTEYSATTVIPPGWRFYIDRAANLMSLRQ